jgi:hypothetical protein
VLLRTRGDGIAQAIFPVQRAPDSAFQQPVNSQRSVDQGLACGSRGTAHLQTSSSRTHGRRRGMTRSSSYSPHMRGLRVSDPRKTAQSGTWALACQPAVQEDCPVPACGTSDSWPGERARRTLGRFLLLLETGAAVRGAPVRRFRPSRPDQARTPTRSRHTIQKASSASLVPGALARANPRNSVQRPLQRPRGAFGYRSCVDPTASVRESG